MASFCNPDLITVPQDRFRMYKPSDVDLDDITDSIKQIGQLQPILVDRNMVLIAGLRRLMSCKRLDRDVWFTTEDDGNLTLDNPMLRRVAEYQENFSRRDFTPAERSTAIAEIDRLMREVYGSKGAHKGNSDGWTQADTAKKLGQKSHRAVSEAIAVDKAIRSGEIPGIEKAKTMQEATKMVKDYVKLEAAKELARRRALSESEFEIKDPIQHFSERILLGDCLKGMKGLPDNICSMFVTDPPFALNLDKLMEDRGEVISKTRGVYEDDEDKILSLTKDVVEQMGRVGRQSCHVIMFCGVQFWHLVKDWLTEAGFKVYKKPMIWVKASTLPFKLIPGRTNNPSLTPGSAYEAFIYAWRGDATLARQGQADVLIYPTLPANEKCHIAQKPVPLLEDIISRLYHPGTNPLLIDPFVGSGSTLVAARRLGISQYFGYELDPENRERAIAYMTNEYMKEQTGEEPSTTINLEDYE